MQIRQSRLILMYHHTRGIIDHARVCVSKNSYMYTNTQHNTIYIHITASSKNAGLDHEYGLVDCITIVKCLWHNDASSCMWSWHTHAYDRIARARVGRWAMLSNDPCSRCSRILLDARLHKKFNSKSKQDKFFCFTKSLFVFSAQVSKDISKA